MEHLHSSIGEQEKINPQQLSRTLESLRYREPPLSGLVTGVFQTNRTVSL